MVRDKLLALLDPLLRPLVVGVGRRYGFVSRLKPYLHGPRERLMVDAGARVANTLFNTRSGVIRVGRGVVFGHDAMVLTGRHRADGSVPEAGHDIIIGPDCRIGSGAIILGRVRIGRGAVVGAGSVVTHDVPDGAKVAGNPAQVVGVLSTRRVWDQAARSR